MRLRSAQLRAKYTLSILMSSKRDLCSLPLSQRKRNWALNVLFLTKCMQVDFAQDVRDLINWNITGGNTPIRQALMDQQAIHLISSIPDSSHFPLFFVEQLLWADRSIIAWTHYRHVAHLKCQGKQARWFSLLANYVQSNQSIFDSLRQTTAMESQRKNFWYFLSDIVPNGTRKPLVLYKDTRGDICIGKITQNARRPSRGMINFSQPLVAHIQKCSYNTSSVPCLSSTLSYIDNLAFITLIPNSFVSIPIDNIKLFPYRSSPQQHFTCFRSWVDWIQFVNSQISFVSAISQCNSSSLPPLLTIHLPGTTECIWIEKWIDNS